MHIAASAAPLQESETRERGQVVAGGGGANSVLPAVLLAAHRQADERYVYGRSGAIREPQGRDRLGREVKALRRLS